MIVKLERALRADYSLRGLRMANAVPIDLIAGGNGGASALLLRVYTNQKAPNREASVASSDKE
jgi:hypothetical protein